MVGTKRTLASLLVILSTIVLTEAKEWRGIVPLHSTRVDVERLLGVSTNACKALSCIYELANENVFILYASGPPCGSDGPSGWRVPRDTVIEVGVYSKRKRRLSDLRINEGKYQKKPNEELPGVFHYVSAEEGIKIEANGDTVLSITYFQSPRDNRLRCADNQPEPSAPGQLSIKQKELLDSFMHRLKQEPAATGWINIDVGRAHPIGAATLTDRVIQYLKNKYSKDFKRITITDGRYLNEGLELFIVPRGKDPIPFQEIRANQCSLKGRSFQ